MDRKEKYLFWFDLETTGLDIEKHEILEISAVLTSFTLEFIASCTRKIRPQHIETATPKALEVNHYSPHDWEDAWSLAGVLGVFARMIPYGDRAIPCGHNIIKFDLPFLRKAFKDTGVFCPLSYWAIDTFPLAVNHLVKNELGADVLPDVKLTTLTKHFDVDHYHAHSAADDVRANIEVYRRMCL